MITLWGRKNSANVQKVVWLLGEMKLPYRHVPAGGAHGGLDAPGFRAMNPHCKVPVLTDGDLSVWESHAILRYLAARYGGTRFWPDDPAARAETDGWMDWAQTALQPAFLNGVFWGFYRTPEEKRDMPAVEKAVADCARLFGTLDRVLADRPFLAGETPGLADIPAGSHLYRYFGLEIDRPPLPNVESWYARLQERPPYRAGVMVPFEDLKERRVY